MRAKPLDQRRLSGGNGADAGLGEQTAVRLRGRAQQTPDEQVDVGCGIAIDDIGSRGPILLSHVSGVVDGRLGSAREARVQLLVVLLVVLPDVVLPVFVQRFDNLVAIGESL